MLAWKLLSSSDIVALNIPSDIVQGTLSGSGASTVSTHSSVPIGTTHASRRVFILVLWDTGTDTRNPAAGTVTINGISATEIITASDSTSGRGGAGWWTAVVPTGTTATVVVTWTDGFGTGNGTAVAVFSYGNLKNSSATGTHAVVDSGTLSIPYNNGDIVLAATIQNVSNTTYSWNTLTEAFDTAVITNGAADCAAVYGRPTSGSPLSVIVTPGATNNRWSTSGFSWG